MTHLFSLPGALHKAHAMASALCAATLCAGCASLSPPPPVDILPTAPPPLAAVPRAAKPVNGSLFSTASYRPAFEDRRARLVGDSVTVQIVENVTASQKSSSTVDRNSKISGGVSALPFVGKTFTDKLAVGATTGNSFDGKGGTESANTFQGSITATVIEVLSNGNLLVSGEKQIAINQGNEFIRFSGIVNPVYVTGSNTVQSTQVADARVEYRANGYIDEAQTMGWMQRFFLTVLPF